jgi:hypothetical protein
MVEKLDKKISILSLTFHTQYMTGFMFSLHLDLIGNNVVKLMRLETKLIIICKLIDCLNVCRTMIEL